MNVCSAVLVYVIADVLYLSSVLRPCTPIFVDRSAFVPKQHLFLYLINRITYNMRLFHYYCGKADLGAELTFPQCYDHAVLLLRRTYAGEVSVSLVIQRKGGRRHLHLHLL